VALQRGFPGYELYFVRKWLRSLRKKQAAWPDLYDFAPVIRMRDLKVMTADLVRRYMMAQTEAIARAKRDKAYTLTVMGKYLRAPNPAALSDAYDIDVQKYMLRVPLTTAEAMKSVLDDLAGRIPKAKDAEPKKFFDDSFVRQMQAGGFIDALYR
jgi:hypothetical protein